MLQLLTMRWQVCQAGEAIVQWMFYLFLNILTYPLKGNNSNSTTCVSYSSYEVRVRSLIICDRSIPPIIHSLYSLVNAIFYYSTTTTNLYDML